MAQQSKLNLKRIGLHLAFWLMVSTIYYKNAQAEGGEEHYWFYMRWLMPIDLAAVYTTAYFLVPQFLLKKRFNTFVILMVVSAAFFVLLTRAVRYYVIFPEIWPQGLEKPFLYFPGLWYIGITLYTFVFLFSGIRLYRSWMEEQRRQMELKTQNLRSELTLLKSQVNPHFLFNTLNNIDLLVFKDQQKASDSIVKLSEIMRYMLYETNGEQVSLDREIQYLKSMVDLMRLRIRDPNFIHFEVTGIAKGKQIPPMILVPFIENAYKHGKKSGTSPGIKIKLTIARELYIFEVENKIEKQNLAAKDQTGGIGLSNVKRRLNLLYPNKYHLDIKETSDTFRVYLELPHTYQPELFQAEKLNEAQQSKIPL